MGVYDTYAGIQLKVGPMDLGNYTKGDTVPIPDGVYVADEGIVVVLNSILAGTFANLISKWGDTLVPREVIEEMHPFAQALKVIREEGL